MQSTLPAHPLPARTTVSVPILGHLARDIRNDITVVFYLLAIVLTAVVLAVQSFGPAALVLAALGAVPVIFLLLLWVTLP